MCDEPGGVGGSPAMIGTPASLTKKKKRRSWFEGDSIQRIEIAVDPREMRLQKRDTSLEETETLELTHFTKPPRLDFGVVQPGGSKCRQLRVTNPHDFTQDVVIERYPYKKGFMVDQTEFSVEMGDEVLLSIVWSPQEAGNYREMLLFRVDGTYRLQAYVFGKAEEAPKPKKRVISGKRPFRQMQPMATRTLMIRQQRAASIIQGQTTPKTMKPRKKVNKSKVPEHREKIEIKQDSMTQTDEIHNQIFTSPSVQITPRTRSRYFPDLTEIENISPERLNCRANGSPEIELTTPVKMALSPKFEKINSSTPIRRETYLTDGYNHVGHRHQTSGPNNKSYLSVACQITSPKMDDIQASTPVRRETYIKHGVDDTYRSKKNICTSPLAGHNRENQTVFLNRSPQFEAVTANTPVRRETYVKSGTHETTPTGSPLCDITNSSRRNMAQENFVYQKPRIPHVIEQFRNEEKMPAPIKQDATPVRRLTHEKLQATLGALTPHVETSPSVSEDAHDKIPTTPGSMRRQSTYTKLKPGNEAEGSGSDVLVNGIEGGLNQYSPKRQHSPNNSDDHKAALDMLEGVKPIKKLKEADLEVGTECHVNSNDSTKSSEESHAIPLTIADLLTEKSDSDLRVSSEDSLMKVVVETHKRDPNNGAKSCSDNHDDGKKSSEDLLNDSLDSVSNYSTANTSFEDGLVEGQLHAVDDIKTVEGIIPTPAISVVPSPDNVLGQTVTHSVVLQKLENVKTELNRRLSSQSGVQVFCSQEAVSQTTVVETVVEDDIFLDAAEFQTSSSATVTIPKGLERRCSSLTVTKQKPCSISDERISSTASRKLFDKQSIVVNDKGIVLPEICSQNMKNGERVAVRGEGAATLEKKTSAQNVNFNPAETITLRKSSESGGTKAWVNNEACPRKYKPAPTLPLKRNATKPTAGAKGDDTDTFKPGSTITLKKSAPAKTSPTKRRSLDGPATEVTARKAVKRAKVDKLNDVGCSSIFLANSTKRLTRTEQLRIKASAAYKEKPKTNNKPPARKPVRRPSGAPKTAQSKLVLLKTNRKTALPSHPLAYAAKNMYYDERWMEKQEHGFVKWLNFVLTPPDVYFEAKKPARIDAGSIAMEAERCGHVDGKLAPSKEVLSFRAYTARRKMNKLRRKACSLFQSDRFVKLIQKLEVEIENGRLAVRKDRRLRADLGIKQRILEMLLSYNPLWLRIGLETVYGEVLFLQSNADVMGLSHFILTRLLGNPDIARQFAHPTVPNLFRDGFEEAIGQFSLKKFLLLACFLDAAKESRIIEHDPCLFCKDADFKSSRDLLISFSKNYLSGEGNLTKHLGYLGYTVTHTQTHLDEYDFAVNNLATDLRDGVRLVRVMELLSGEYVLSKNLRLPAISRLQKIHNSEVTFNALAERGIEVRSEKGGKIDPRDIVDGHREKTLALLWRIIFNFQVEVVLNVQQLKQEVDFLRQNLKVKVEMDALLFNNIDTLGLPRANRRESMEPDLYFKSDRLHLLLKWCRAVCAYYGVKVENFTVSFSDGRALCYLVHHYHPGLLPADTIKQETTQTYMSGPDEAPDGEDSDNSFLDTWTTDTSPGNGKSAIFKNLLDNEKENFKLLYEKVSELGGIPLLLKYTDMSNTIPDEKLVVTYVSYLCARLLDIREEARAARIIQSAWRAHRLRHQQHLYQVKQKNILVIQRAVRHFLARRRAERQQKAAVRIQAWWKSVLCQQLLRKHKEEKEQKLYSSAARTLQNFCKVAILRKKLKKQQAAVTIISAAWRGFKIRQAAAKQQASARLIQQWYRASKQTRQDKQDYLNMKRAANCIQRVVRGHQTRQQMRSQQVAATVIQKVWKGCIARRDFQHQRRSAATIQQWYRATQGSGLVRKQYLEQRNAAVMIQRCLRGFFVRQRLWTERKAAVTIQQVWKGYSVRKRLKEQQKYALVIQNWYRKNKIAKVQREKFLQQRKAAVVLQKYARRIIIQQRVVKLNNAAVKIQSVVRMFLAKQRYYRLCSATVSLQQHWRAKLMMRYAEAEFQKLKVVTVFVQRLYRAKLQLRAQERLKAAIYIQSCWRGYLARQKYLTIHKAVTKIQRRYRAYTARCGFLQAKSSAMKIQMWYRACCKRRQFQQDFNTICRGVVQLQAVFRGRTIRLWYQQQRNAACKIQAVWRMYQCNQQFYMKKYAAVCIQQFWRSYKTGKKTRSKYLKQKQAAVTIQSLVRMYRCRKQYRQMKCAATSVQAAIRCHLQRLRYQQVKNAAIFLQRKYRANCLMNKEMNAYQEKRRCCVLIQSAWRQYISRREYVRQRNACIVIQAVFKQYVQRRIFCELKCAAIAIQRRWRATIKKQEEMMRFQRARQDIIAVQACVRGFLSRRRYLKLQCAALIIQTHLRAYVAKRECQRRKLAVYTLQKHIHSWYEMRVQRRSYLTAKQAAICIQSFIRCYQARVAYIQKQKAATLIQAHFRRHTEQQKFIRQREAVKTLQVYIRAYLNGKRQKNEYEQKKNAVLTIQRIVRGHLARKQARLLRNVRRVQACIRGYLVRKRLSKYRSCCVKIQSLWRMHSQRKKYKRLKTMAIVLQERFRARKQGTIARRQYHVKRGAIITIQSSMRGCLLRKKVRLMHAAALILQSSFRRHIEARRYKTMKSAAVSIQRWWRRWMLVRESRKDFYSTRISVIKIQSAVRGWICRRKVTRLHSTATQLQAVYKGYKVRCQYQQIREATKTIQQRFRAYMEMKKQIRQYNIQRCAIITLQAGVRGYIDRLTMKRKHQSATKIQSVFRGYLAKKEFSLQKKAAVVIQIRLRAHMAMVEERKVYLRAREAALRIQGFYHGCKVRKETKRWKEAACIIQASYHGYRCRCKYQQMRDAARKIQETYRALKKMQKQKRQYHIQRGAVITLQACVRGYIERQNLKRMHEAATVIQSIFKGYVSRRKFLMQKRAALVIQAKLRAHLAMIDRRSVYLRTREAVLRLQGFYHGCKVRNEIKCWNQAACLIQERYRIYRVRQQYLAKKQAASTIARWYRANKLAQKQRLVYMTQLRSLIYIQACVRGYLVRREVRRQSKAAVLLQSVIRGYLAHKKYEQLHTAVRVLQCRFRAQKAMLCQKNIYREQRQSAVTIQSWYRGVACRIELQRQHLAARTVQATYRGYRVRQSCCRLKCAARTIDSWYHRVLMMREARQHFLSIRSGAIVIQSAYRGWKERQLARRERAARTLQATLCGYVQRRKYQATKKKVLLCQAAVRGWLARKEVSIIKQQHYCATLIQKTYRGYHTRKILKEQWAQRAVHLDRFSMVTMVHLYTIQIQRWFRRHQALQRAQQQLHSVLLIQRWIRGRLARLRYLRMLRSIVAFQRAVRKHQHRRLDSVVIIQSAVRGWLARQRWLKYHKAATTIQAIWRGYKLRKGSQSKKLSLARERVAAANQAAREHRTLGSRTESALDYLLRSKQLAYILQKVTDLEVATRLSPECCEMIVEYNAVGVIYQLIRNCNRSVGHMEILKYSVSVLLNLAKYHKTIDAVYGVEGAIDTLLDLMMIYREKGCAIFTRTCMLLGVLGYDKDRRAHMVQTTKVQEKVRSIYSIILRKHKVKEKQQQVKNRLAASRSFCGAAPALTPTKHPKLRPDWVLTRNKLSDISDPLKAIVFVMNCFQIMT